MDNSEYKNEVRLRIQEIAKLRKESLTLSKEIIGKTMLREDLLFCAVIDRSIQLMDGFVAMLEMRNLSCAGAILRLQMDNCMRTYAFYLAQNKNAIIDCIIYGRKLSDQWSIDSKKMSDGYLKQKMKVFDDSFAHVYNQVSGYIHLSDRAFYQTVIECTDEGIEWQIGSSLLEKHNPVLIEAADLFIRYTLIHQQILKPVANSKLEIEKKTHLQ